MVVPKLIIQIYFYFFGKYNPNNLGKSIPRKENNVIELQILILCGNKGLL